jgi:hypothetical protein
MLKSIATPLSQGTQIRKYVAQCRVRNVAETEDLHVPQKNVDDNGWLAPNGKFYEITLDEYAAHGRWVLEHYDLFPGFDPSPYNEKIKEIESKEHESYDLADVLAEACNIAFKYGWFRIVAWESLLYVDGPPLSKMTKAQKNVLEDSYFSKINRDPTWKILNSNYPRKDIVLFGK